MKLLLNNVKNVLCCQPQPQLMPSYLHKHTRGLYSISRSRV